MSDEQINIAIAEIIRPALHVNIYHPTRDYCNDQNAMHEAVTTLPENKWVLYGVRLAWECGHTDKKSVGLWHISTATAYHRAVAFLKTLEKWEETK